jgi:hypothetical protein
MSRRRVLLLAGGGGLVLAVALLCWQRAWLARFRTPSWTDPEQPPEGTAGQPVGPSPAAAWLACRPGDPGLRGGGRIMRTYPSTLADDPDSPVR